MADQGQGESIGRHRSDSDSPHVPSPVIPPTRRSTGSTTSSAHNATPVPIPPGFYTLPIHGNCPRCHHHHRAATINVRVSGDYNRVSHVYCERCGEKWLALGGANTTRISLLSTQTTEPDLVEMDFRKTLVAMVRSVTSIASTAALASVPEQPSGGPSSEDSIQSRAVSEEREEFQQEFEKAHETNTEQDEIQAAAASIPSMAQASFKTTKGLNDAGGTRRNRKNIFLHFMKKVKERFPVLKRVSLKQLLQKSRGTKLTAKGHGKLPVDQVYPNSRTEDKALAVEDPRPTATDEVIKEPVGEDTEPEDQQTEPCTPRPAPPTTNNIDKDMLRAMTKEQRIVWIREQFSDLRCRCSRPCNCRQAPSSKDLSHTGGTGTPCSPPPQSPHLSPHQSAERRHSLDLLLIGSHLNGFQAAELNPPLHPVTISTGSTTRFSQAATMVQSDGITVTSGGPYLDVVHHPTQRSRSPRPLSLPVGPSRLRQSTGADDSESRASVDSFTSGGPVRSVARLADQHQHHSTPSLPATPLPASAPDGTPGASRASTPYGNGHRTSDERDRES